MLIEIRSVEPALDTFLKPFLLLQKEKGDKEGLFLVTSEYGFSRVVAILQKTRFVQPTTSQLLGSIFEKTGLRVERAIITSLQPVSGFTAPAFFALIQIGKGPETFSFDCGSLDALMIALTAGAPIFIEEKIFDENKTTISETPDSDGSGSGTALPGAQKLLPGKTGTDGEAIDEKKLEEWRKELFDLPQTPPDKPPENELS